MLNTVEIEKLQYDYKPGTRIQYSESGTFDKQEQIQKGTVEFVDDFGVVFVGWDNGSRSAIDPNKGEFKKLSVDDQILEAEAVRNEQIANKHRKRDRNAHNKHDRKAHKENDNMERD